MAQINSQQMAALLSNLIAGEGSMNENTSIKYEGTAIILPEGMTENEAITALERRRDENDSDVNVRELIPGYPLDALLGLQRAMKQKYGWTGLVPTPGFFGSRPPQMVAVTINAAGDTVSVPWGRMTIPGVKGYIQPSVQFDAHGQPQLLLGGVVQRRFLAHVGSIAALAREEVRLNSIYKGKAIRIEFPTFDEDHPFDPQVHVPEYLNLNGVTRSDLIFREEVEWAVQTNIFTPVENLPLLRSMGTPFHRGILALGEYGTGKTLLANVTAKLCQQNGITFIYLAKTSDLAQARAFATQYAPAVIFAEDVDSLLGGDSRSEDVNSILNVIDGIEGKHDEVMVIFSTNHPERINRALLRPGRVDAVITIEAPDAAAARRLVRLYAKDTLDAASDLNEVGDLLAGHIPAAIREVVERAKLAAIPRIQNGMVTINADDLTLAAKSMRGHLAMLKEKPVKPATEVEKFGTAVGVALAAAQAQA